MNDDATEIRALVSQWHSARELGDVEKVLALISDDAIFLVAGRAPMGKQEFSSLPRPQPDQQGSAPFQPA